MPAGEPRKPRYTVRSVLLQRHFQLCILQIFFSTNCYPSCFECKSVFNMKEYPSESRLFGKLVWVLSGRSITKQQLVCIGFVVRGRLFLLRFGEDFTHRILCGRHIHLISLALQFHCLAKFVFLVSTTRQATFITQTFDGTLIFQFTYLGIINSNKRIAQQTQIFHLVWCDYHCDDGDLRESLVRKRQ